MTTAVSQPAQNFRCLEGLRGYMAWCVVASHAVGLTQTGADLPHFLLYFTNGENAVNEFIILSGFVIAHLIVTQAEPYRPYIVRRGFRIIPIYCVCVLISALAPPVKFAVAAVLGLPQPEAMAAELAAIASNFWQHVWLHATLLHGVVPDDVLPHSSTAFLGPAWSLSLEWQFYLIAPLILWLLRKSIAAQALTTAALLAAFFVFTSGEFGEWKYPSMLFLSIHFFLVGILSRLWLDALARLKFWIGPALLLALAAVLPAVRWELAIWAFFYMAVVNERFAPALPALVDRPLRWITANPLIAALGRVSYSTYLIHLPLIAIVFALAAPFIATPGKSAAIVTMTLAVLLTIPVSFLLYWLIEQRFIRIGRRFHGARLPAAVEVA